MDDGVILTPLIIAGLLVRRWRMLVAVPLLTAVVAVAIALLLRDYTARSRFVPQSSSADVGRLAGLAAQMGFVIGGDGADESPDFYVDLVTSGEVLRPALTREYHFARETGSTDTIRGTYLDLAGIEGDTEEERLRNGEDALRDAVGASASVKSGVVTLRTTAAYPGLAEAVNAAILERVSEFDRERRQASARAERTFVEARLDAARTDLESAEAELAGWLERNRRPESPRLMIALERQQRQVTLRQEVYAALAQAYEQARIEEVRNTPVITIVDRPDGSARPTRRLPLVALIGLLAGTVATAGLLIAWEYFARRSESGDMQELRSVLRVRRQRAHIGGASP
jgi:uncharacterized protein involved in exopolysaccharide biosynthesis